ncbi:TPA: hypothetical protein HA246_07720 [Candidatus Woesearchaeota archaeon]|nr:hypothetical protein [Candidatus Woesearchaeota archaeon]
MKRNYVIIPLTAILLGLGIGGSLSLRRSSQTNPQTIEHKIQAANVNPLQADTSSSKPLDTSSSQDAPSSQASSKLLPSKDEYLLPYQKLSETRGQRAEAMIRQIHQGREVRGILEQSSLAELIIDSFFEPYRANTPDIESADLIILGDVHHIFAESLDMVLTRSVRRDDALLVEMSPDEAGILDFRVMDPLNRYLLSHELSPFSEDREFGGILAKRGHGRRIPIDSTSEVKNRMLYSIIRTDILKSAIRSIERGEQLHPFQVWMIYDDLSLCSPNDNGNLSSVINRYLVSAPNLDDIEYERQRQIVANVTKVTGSKPVGERHVLVIGAAHISEYPEASLSDSLEHRSIRYFAFLPNWDLQNEVMLDTGAQRLDLESTRQSTQRRLQNSEYVAEKLVPWYLSLRNQEGVHYTGTLKGLAERLSNR